MEENKFFDLSEGYIKKSKYLRQLVSQNVWDADLTKVQSQKAIDQNIRNLANMQRFRGKNFNLRSQTKV